MSTAESRDRLSFQRALELVEVNLKQNEHRSGPRRFFSRRPSWKPGHELPWESVLGPQGKAAVNRAPGAYGGFVFAQASLAASRLVSQRDQWSLAREKRQGIHASFTSAATPVLALVLTTIRLSMAFSQEQVISTARTSTIYRQSSQLRPFPPIWSPLDNRRNHPYALLVHLLLPMPRPTLVMCALLHWSHLKPILSLPPRLNLLNPRNSDIVSF